MKIYQNLTMAIFLTLFSTLTYSQESNVEACNGCSELQVGTNANSWGRRNLSLGETALYHAVDFEARKITSREVSIQMVPLPPPFPPEPLPRSKLASTPAFIKQEVESLFDNLDEISAAAEKTTIPKEVIADAWEFVNCAYCANRVSDYIRNTAFMERAWSNVEAIANSLGLLSTSVPSIYRIGLEAGGEIIIKLTLLGDTTLEVTVESIKDPDGNKVSVDANSLKSLRIYVGSPVRQQSVNIWINPLGYKAPGVGRVIIEECSLAAPPWC